MSDQFHAQPFEQRWGKMDDEARGVFEAVWPKAHISYGLDRAPIGVHKWPIKWRYAPDLADSDGLIELQGFGRDRLLKIKDDKRQALNAWREEGLVRFFVWDRTEKRWAIEDWRVLDSLLDYPHVIGQYHDGPKYGALHSDQLTDLPWIHYDPTTT